MKPFMWWIAITAALLGEAAALYRPQWRWVVVVWPLDTMAWICLAWWSQRLSAGWHELYLREQAMVHQLLGLNEHEGSAPAPPQ